MPGLSELFQSMSYNEEERLDLSSISSWLAPHNYRISYIVNGQWSGDSSSTTTSSTLELGSNSVSINFAAAQLLRQTLQGQETPEDVQPVTNVQERLQQLRNLVRDKKELSLLESFATNTPLSQLVQFDQATWNQAISPQSSSLPAKFNIVLVTLNQATYSLDKFLSSVIFPALESDGEFRVILRLASSSQSPALLPIVFAIDAVNKAHIRKRPIDILILDKDCKESLQVLKESSDIIVRGASWDDLESQLPVRLISGEFRSRSGVTGAHFIVDSSADVQTAVETISANVWCSGLKVNAGARSLLFVHESVYNNVKEGLQRKISRLRIARDFTQKMADFIQISSSTISFNNKLPVIPQGAKAFPVDSDLTVPTLVYEIGTSSELIASTRPRTAHILALIPYRNNAELVQLSNNLDQGNQVFVYATDSSFLKLVATGLKGKEDVWWNGSKSRQNPGQRQPAALLGEETGKVDSVNSSAIDKAIGVVRGAEKSLKSWSSQGISRRCQLLEQVFSTSFITGQKEREAHHNLLLKIAGGLTTSTLDNLTLKNSQPLGSVVILFVDSGAGQKQGPSPPLNLWTRLMTILISALKGNVTTAVCVGSTDESIKEIESAFQDSQGQGLVREAVNITRLESSGVSQFLHQLGQLGKVNALWIVQNHKDSTVPLAQVPVSAFNRVLVDTGDLTSAQLIERGGQLEYSQVIHL